MRLLNYVSGDPSIAGMLSSVLGCKNRKDGWVGRCTAVQPLVRLGRGARPGKNCPRTLWGLKVTTTQHRWVDMIVNAAGPDIWIPAH